VFSSVISSRSDKHTAHSTRSCMIFRVEIKRTNVEYVSSEHWVFLQVDYSFGFWSYYPIHCVDWNGLWLALYILHTVCEIAHFMNWQLHTPVWKSYAFSNFLIPFVPHNYYSVTSYHSQCASKQLTNSQSKRSSLTEVASVETCRNNGKP